MQLREISTYAQDNEVKIIKETRPQDNVMETLDMRYSLLFERVALRLKNHVGSDVYASWFQRLKFHSILNNVIHLSVPTTFLKAWIKNRYLEIITKLFQEEDKTILKVDVVVRTATRFSSEKPSLPVSSQSYSPLKPISSNVITSTLNPKTVSPLFGSPLDTRFTFSSFIEGSSNRVALAAARTIAEMGAKSTVRFNPLFIHASVGLGKTHLLQAIANEAIENKDGLRIVYLTAEYFMWRFATAIRDNCALNLKDSLRNIDLLMIDDMQFLQGKLIQHEFCHLLNALLDSAKTVVVAADRPPSELESLDPRVRSRLQGGVSLELGSHDYDIRLAILKNRLKNSQIGDTSLNIPEEILVHVARSITSSGRELDGAFNQLVFRHSFEPLLTIDLVDEILTHLIKSSEPRRIRIEDIQRLVSRHYNVSRQDLLSSRRTRVVVKPRQIAMYLSKIMTTRSFPEIGRRFGDRDHTTVLHAVRKVETMLETDTKLLKEIELLKRLIAE
ncbi:Chromosomal replication initiator protein DnaA [Liberibacter crescens BT-1]|uniref:Chromosomal replication initiator protein DnaA n=1 Tax=Liberibacter crescens (strain BT-1) TaxID=1215343 RepID=L0EWG1_LIBCB|nr:chromosomal replication initiator protein DnaA [Liberibacter crescens]AGA65185.1 Chromosomal replication initiator protein DnaA [Liberibacter crescens BT-1]AMC13141.1 chromosomal replication initiation protein [Liberibacter crescens]